MVTEQAPEVNSLKHLTAEAQAERDAIVAWLQANVEALKAVGGPKGTLGSELLAEIVRRIASCEHHRR